MSVTTRSVAIVTLGCTRNDVDSEELAGRLSAEGWTLVDDAADAVELLIDKGLTDAQQVVHAPRP